MASEPLPHLESPSLANYPLGPASQRAHNIEPWNKVIDELLVKWGRHPELLKDDGIDAPTGAAIAAANAAACLLRDQEAPPPTNVSPTGDGGIALHYEHNDVLFTIEFDPDGHRELRLHFDGQLVRLTDSAGT